ncbi:hypothetical protein D1115_06440 [Vibrio alfacsensis]|uniref:Uncharacterized protein n=1 Tax=Vibrio alfacsensis TaxID=1074311 RepID=A0ABM6YTD9_9VIBR|nr:hypothetical protein [Vibrio alfacsensis]AXY00917.1 hypothetical protein D1115_06440 [Vibrio alfacsensis]
MCKQSSLSKYQKQIVKELTGLMGVNIPFTYEKAQNNHLKVLIDGIEKPLYTGSTPSDRNSAKNFIAQVKRAIKDMALDVNEELEAAKRAIPFENVQNKEVDKMVECCIKSLRTRKESLKKKETDYLLEQGDLDLLHPYRSEVVKLTLEHAMKQRKQLGYFRPKQKKELEKSVRKHLDFIMPNKADYSDLLACQHTERDSQTVQQSYLEASNVVMLDTTNQGSSPVVQRQSASHEEAVTKLELTDQAQHGNIALQLMNIAKGKRVDMLRDLSHDHIIQLLADIEQAKELNIRCAIADIKQLVKVNDVPLERLFDALNR